MVWYEGVNEAIERFLSFADCFHEFNFNCLRKSVIIFSYFAIFLCLLLKYSHEDSSHLFSG